MSKDVKINTSKDLRTFLQILSEESVARAREVGPAPRDIGSEQADLVKRMRSDLSRFSTMSEEDEPEEDPRPPADDSGKSSDEEDEEQDQPELADEETTFAKFRLAINDIRSGNSIKNPDVRANLEDYYRKLDEDEAKVLILFFKAIGNILHGRKSGESAQDPSDPPSSINISHGAGERPVEPEQGQSASAKAPSPEDTSAPIKVGAQQVKEQIRERVRKLMRE